MDRTLRQNLDAQNWTEIVGRLTLAAVHQLRVCGYTADVEGRVMTPSGKGAPDYAIDAICKAYEACDTGTNMWDPDRGELYPFLERLTRRLVNDDYRTAHGRPAMASLECLEIEPRDESIAETDLNTAFQNADAELQGFMLNVIERADSTGGINWTEFRTELGLTRHAANALRERLRVLLQRSGATADDG